MTLRHFPFLIQKQFIYAKYCDLIWPIIVIITQNSAVILNVDYTTLYGYFKNEGKGAQIMMPQINHCLYIEIRRLD